MSDILRENFQKLYDTLDGYVLPQSIFLCFGRQYWERKPHSSQEMKAFEAELHSLGELLSFKFVLARVCPWGLQLKAGCLLS